MLRTANTLLVYAFAGMLLLLSTIAWAQTAAGTRIQNQASAVYKFDGDDTVRTATSNLVTTLIQQVANVDLKQNSSKFAAKDSAVFFPHVLTNTGNGVDEFALSLSNLTGDNFDLTDLKLYADANHDGQPDNINTPLTATEKIPLAQGESFYFIASGKLPSSVSDGQEAKLTVKATSQFTPAVSIANTDTVIATNKAVVQVTRAISHSSGASPSGALPSTGYTVTLTYQNHSAVNATNITIIDKLPGGMTYIAGSAKWSVMPSSSGSLNDTGLQTNSDINFCAYNAACTGTDQATDKLMAKISKLDANSSASISFQFSIDSGLAASILESKAQFKYENSGNSGGVTSLEDTNTTPFEVLQDYKVVINGSAANSADGQDEPVTINSVVQGGTIHFTNYVWNTGNGKDTFDLSIDSDKTKTTFPKGTFFQFLRADGKSPLMDTNGNGVVDTGVLARGESRTITVRAMLPSGAVGNNGENGYLLRVIATSKVGNSENNDITNKLLTIEKSAVDLTSDQPRNETSPAPGQGADPEATPLAMSLDSGKKGTLRLYVNNTSSRPDRYLLSYSEVSGFDPINVLPAGWKVDFYFDGGTNDCKTLGNLTYTSGLINAGKNRLICAVVSVSKAVAPSKQPIYFRALSTATGAKDVMYYEVNIGASYLLTIEPNQYGQTIAGASVIYSHTVNNYSNTSLSNINITSTNNTKGWNNMVYVDTNNNAILDAADALFTNEMLGVGESLVVFIKVFAPIDAKLGTENITLLKLQGMNTETQQPIEGSSAIAVTQISVGSVVIIKEQALDANCDGNLSGPNSCSNDACFTAATFSVSQGQCVIYRLTATNNSTKAVDNVQINDVVPDFTSYYAKNGYPYPSTTHGGISKDQDGNIVAGAIDGASTNLKAGESMVLKFAVRLD